VGAIAALANLSEVIVRGYARRTQRSCGRVWPARNTLSMSPLSSTRLVGDSAPLSLHVNLPRTTTVERCVGLQCNDFRHGDVIPAATPGCTKV